VGGDVIYNLMRLNPSLVLATDLDGTFLGGSDRQRTEFYEYIENHRDRMLLVFVTGRDLEAIERMRREMSFPRPDYIIGDVGTTIVEGKTFEPLLTVQNWVSSIWNDANDRVKEMLADEPGIKLQPVNPERRVSYYYQPDELQASTVQKILDAGFDCILSAEKYLDVMPKGVAKGSTLLRSIEALDLDAEYVITAGDSLNDYSLFQTGLKSIAVGNCEPKLADKIKTMPNVYRSPEAGAAGIWDGLKYYGKHF
jgi:HAD superfamily hydrolase (TIGR01484 family)